MKPGCSDCAASTSMVIRTASMPQVAALHTFESMVLCDHAEVPSGRLPRSECYRKVIYSWCSQNAECRIERGSQKSSKFEVRMKNLEKGWRTCFFILNSHF